jgi:hypothetical protein
MTIGRLISAASSVAVPLATSDTSAAPSASWACPKSRRKGTSPPCFCVDGHFELQARLARGQRHDENSRGQEALADELGRLHEGVRHHLQFALAAARQQGKNGKSLGSELFAHCLLAGFQRDDVGQRMPDIGHRNARLLVERRLHREQASRRSTARPIFLIRPPRQAQIDGLT